MTRINIWLMVTIFLLSMYLWGGWEVLQFLFVGFGIWYHIEYLLIGLVKRDW